MYTVTFVSVRNMDKLKGYAYTPILQGHYFMQQISFVASCRHF